MEGTDISHPIPQSPDVYVAEVTYYGNGCSNGWENTPPLYGGSPTSCDTRIIKSYDGEDQKNGTYYSPSSTTAQSANSLATNNSNAPDTFCPLGWQLPYGGTGGDYYDQSKSWKYLLMTKYGLSDNVPSSQATRSYPLSHIYSGYYATDTGALHSQTVTGYNWTPTVYNMNNMYRQRTSVPGIYLESGARSYAFPIRCVKFLTSTHRRHGGRNTC